MAVLPVGYTKFIDSLASGLVNLHTDTLAAMLLADYTVGTTPDDAQFVADVLAAATETSGDGYTAGGQELSTVAWTQIGSAWFLTCDDLTWDPSTIAAAYIVFYDKSPGTDETNPVISFFDFGGTRTSDASPFTVEMNASGLFSFTNISS